MDKDPFYGQIAQIAPIFVQCMPNKIKMILCDSHKITCHKFQFLLSPTKSCMKSELRLDEPQLKSDWKAFKV